MRNPEHPIYGWSNPTDHYQLVFGVDRPGAMVMFDTPQAFPDFLGNYMFSFQLIDGYPGGSEFFDVFFDIVTVGTLDRATWSGFNPQPDPPMTHVAFEFDVMPNSATSVAVGVQIANRSTGDLGSFSIVPEPATITLLLAGGIGLLGRRRARPRISQADPLISHDDA